MPRVLVTGMSGTGKSSALVELGRRGHRVVDTDYGGWTASDGLWREDAMAALLAGHRRGALFVAGCTSNQGRFHGWFDHVVLLSAPVDVLMARIATRTSNPYGKSEHERREILQNVREVEPLLRRSATAEIDATAPLDDVVRRLEHLVSAG